MSTALEIIENYKNKEIPFRAAFGLIFNSISFSSKSAIQYLIERNFLRSLLSIVQKQLVRISSTSYERKVKIILKLVYLFRTLLSL